MPFTTHTQTIHLGAGTLAHLPAALADLGWERVWLCTSGSYTRNGLTAQLQTVLGAACVGVFDQTAPHVPEAQVSQLTALAGAARTQVVLALGGGSAIGLAKACAAGLGVPAAAIPTTYAGSEMTPVYGITRMVEGTPRKIITRQVAPRLVLYDPVLTLDLPAALTLTTGINALAHALEALYSPTRHPLSTLAALEAARLIPVALRRCLAQPTDLAARTEMLLAAHLAGAALGTVEMALHHGTCHVLGGTAGVPHGAAHCIVLPHALRFTAPVAGPLLAPAAHAWGIDPTLPPETAALHLADQVAALLTELGAPTRLSAVGVPRSVLPALAHAVHASPTVRRHPRPFHDEAEAQAWLAAMW